MCFVVNSNFSIVLIQILTNAVPSTYLTRQNVTGLLQVVEIQLGDINVNACLGSEILMALLVKASASLFTRFHSCLITYI